jgi:hypothetical protein
MIAICKKPTTRLVKGARYEIENLWNDGTNQRWLEGRLSIKGIGRFKAGNFTDDSGNELPKTNIVKPFVQIERLKFEDLKEGDILVCTSGSYKTLIQNAMYRIEKLIDKTTQVQHSRGNWTKTDQSIKFVGYPRALKFSAWSFRALTAEESREIGLSALLDGKEPPVISKRPKKKIDHMENKDQVLIEVLFKSVIDPNRHALTIPKWACEKTAPKLGLEVEDFASIMEMSLKDILDIMEKKSI